MTDLRTAAAEYARAWLSVDLAAITRSHGPGCGNGGSRPAIDDKALAPEAREMRSKLEQQLGVPLSSIKVRGVLVRKVTRATGEAEVEYNQPIRVTGDDNWVAYELHDGRWTNDCKLPIGSGSHDPAHPSSSISAVAAP